MSRVLYLLKSAGRRKQRKQTLCENTFNPYESMSLNGSILVDCLF